jgi:hypothetical protein
LANTAIFAIADYSITLKYQKTKVKEGSFSPMIEFIFDASITHKSAKIINLNIEVSLLDSNNNKFIVRYGNSRDHYDLKPNADIPISIIL